jgi:BirA family biotin operon repressor/biotin-[acetyl-CoA-carboxylase] ligase
MISLRMNRVGEVLGFLRESPGYVSGDYISSKLNLSRTAVWKYINQLKQMGYSFDTLKGKGYSLRSAPDRLYPWEIERHLHTSLIGRTIAYKDSVESTNGLAFSMALADAAEGTCVVAETQKAGKGRLKRKWFSPYGKNLYLSVILHPRLHPARVYPITFLSSVAVHDTLTELGLKPALKWPNDVLVNGRKLCGTLLELSTEADLVRFVIVGIGLNINMRRGDFDEEISPKATSMLIEMKNPFERAKVCGMLLDNLEAYYDMLSKDGMAKLCRVWEERAQIKGVRMEVVQMANVVRGVAEGVDEDGALLLNDNGTIRKIIVGDVTF